jgi:SAM-dependent methyltransferase
VKDRVSESDSSRAGRASALGWLRTEAGAALLTEAASLPRDRLTRLERLRRRYPAEIATAAVELLELRLRARRKFAWADAMFFTPEGLEQSTGEEIARYRAGRFPADVPVLDACCGIGGDALALAARGPVLAVDRDPAVIVCARANTDLDCATSNSKVHTLCADVTTLDLARLRAAGFEAAVFDPSRRTDRRTGERRRARAAEEYTPPLSWLETLRAHFPLLAVKVSPALDDAALCRYGAQVEFLSDRGECKEAVLWFGKRSGIDAEPIAGQEGSEGYMATALRPDRAPATLTPFACDPPALSFPHAWLYEPDPAVIRAHLVPQIAALLNAAQLDSQIAYLTAEHPTPTPFATAYPVLEWLPFQLKNVQARLRVLGRRVTAIKRRGVPLEPEALRKRLTGDPAGDAEAVVVLTRVADKPVAVLCGPPVSA